jgi:hypothetical protein
VGEHRTLGGFYPVLHGEKVISGESIRDFPETSKGTGETDHHDTIDSFPPSGVDRADREDGPRPLRNTAQRPMTGQPKHKEERS